MFGMEMRELLIVGGGGVLGLAILLLLARSFLRGGRKVEVAKKAASLREILGEYPDAPPYKDGLRLWVDGIPTRLRLVVLVPMGTEREPIDVDQVPDLLNFAIRGMSECVKNDKPRIRVWPPQLSVAGFPPTFFREVVSPDEDDTPSPWIRLAGSIKAHGKPYLLGLALYADDATDIGTVRVEPNEWIKHLQIQK